MNDEKLNGLWLDDTFLSTTIHRISPLAVKLYLMIGTYKSIKEYRTGKVLARRIKRNESFVKEAIQELIDCELLNDTDIKALKLEELDV